MTCVLLAINRFFEILFPKAAEFLFHKNFMVVWLAVPVAYWGLIFMTMTPAMYNTYFHGFYYDPYYGTPGVEKDDAVWRGLIVATNILILVSPHSNVSLQQLFYRSYSWLILYHTLHYDNY